MLLTLAMATLFMVQLSPSSSRPAAPPLDLEGTVQCSTTFLTMSSTAEYTQTLRDSQRRHLLRFIVHAEALGQRTGLTRDTLMAQLRARAGERITAYDTLPSDGARSTQRLQWMIDSLACQRRLPATTTIVDTSAPSKAVALDLDTGIRCASASLAAVTLEKDAAIKAANRVELLTMSRKILPLAEREGLTRDQMLARVQKRSEARMQEFTFGNPATQARLVAGLATERADCQRRLSLTP